MMLAVFVLVAIPSISHAQVENLVLNFSFEEDEVILNDPDWEQWCTWNPEDVLGSIVEIDDTEFIDGKRSLRIEPVGTENWHLVVAYISVQVTNGADVTTSFWAKAAEPRPLTAAYKAADNSVTWGDTTFDLTTDWAEYTMTSASLSDDVKVELWCAADPATIWLDFVYIYEGEYVPGISPLPPLKASAPIPADGALHEDTWINLSWSPGLLAASHDVYLGDDFDAVSEAAADTFRGNQAAPFYVAGFPGFAYPEGLTPGTTYYWRIDEVNEADPNSPWKGDVWSFSVPPKTAYNPDPADAAEAVAPDNVTLRWTPGYGAKLHAVYFGDDYDQVESATGAAMLGGAVYNAGKLEAEKVYYWRVDEFDGTDTYKGHVWTFTTPGSVGGPQPANGAVDVSLAATLSWTSADNAVSHDLYLGTDKDAVRNATTASPEFKGNMAKGSESYDPGKLAWDSDYYWRADAVYASGPMKGPIWTFATADFLLVDDFESYNDIDPPDPNGNRIFDNWIDGFGTQNNGALIGNDLPPYAEQTIVHGGAQAMIYRYDNELKTSEATLTLVWPRDWTEEAVTKLSLWFRGAQANSAERMFVALDGNAVVYHENAAATQQLGWNNWIIDLQSFADQGVNLANVNNITIGFGTKGTPAAGGMGTMYFDDIRLYR